MAVAVIDAATEGAQSVGMVRTSSGRSPAAPVALRSSLPAAHPRDETSLFRLCFSYTTAGSSFARKPARLLREPEEEMAGFATEDPFARCRSTSSSFSIEPPRATAKAASGMDRTTSLTNTFSLADGPANPFYDGLASSSNRFSPDYILRAFRQRSTLQDPGSFVQLPQSRVDSYGPSAGARGSLHAFFASLSEKANQTPHIGL